MKKQNRYISWYNKRIKVFTKELIYKLNICKYFVLLSKEKIQNITKTEVERFWFYKEFDKIVKSPKYDHWSI